MEMEMDLERLEAREAALWHQVQGNGPIQASTPPLLDRIARLNAQPSEMNGSIASFSKLVQLCTILSH